LRDGLLVVVQQTMQPQAVSFWVRKVIQHDMGMLSTHTQWREKDWQTMREEGKQKKHEHATDSFHSIVPSEITVC
jgi:hypothetical protein